ncbi:hypothetical protein RFI_11082, partial [Reticulomyxa filosa]
KIKKKKNEIKKNDNVKKRKKKIKKKETKGKNKKKDKKETKVKIRKKVEVENAQSCKSSKSQKMENRSIQSGPFCGVESAEQVWKFISFTTRSIGKKSIAIKVSTQVYENNCRFANRQRVRPTSICRFQQRQVKLNCYGNCNNFIRKKNNINWLYAHIRNLEVWIVHMPIEEVKAPKNEKKIRRMILNQYHIVNCSVGYTVNIRSNHVSHCKSDDVIKQTYQEEKKKENNTRKLEVMPTLWCRKDGREKYDVMKTLKPSRWTLKKKKSLTRFADFGYWSFTPASGDFTFPDMHRTAIYQLQ